VIQRSPWSDNDLLLLVAVWILGAAFVAASYEVISGKPRFEDQAGWLSLAVAGVVVAFAGQAIWLLRGRRAVGERCHALLFAEHRVRGSYSALARSETLVAGDGLALYHRADCPMVGERWRTAVRSAHEAAGRVACGICRP
jgi:hypothetical protein